MAQNVQKQVKAVTQWSINHAWSLHTRMSLNVGMMGNAKKNMKKNIA